MQAATLRQSRFRLTRSERPSGRLGRTPDDALHLRWRSLLLHGGAKRDRTADPLLARQVLSQLSYVPMNVSLLKGMKLVGLSGLEPPTSPLSGVRSNQLS